MATRIPSLLVAAMMSALAACGTSTTEVLHTSTGSGGAASTTTGTGTASTGGTGGTDGGAPVACKRGMAYGYDSVADLTALSKGIGWWYNWSPKPDNTTVAAAYPGIGVEFVPMAWGQASVAGLPGQVPADARYLLGFNEPNFGSQANLTPAQAAALWPQLQAFAQQHKLALVSPAVNYCGSPCNVTNPFDWLDQFFAACPGCQVDYIAMHWYACTGSALTGYLSAQILN